ncbi:hypothetical protein DFH29DRAFT_910741, partial [Suillus ampliporus]
MYTLTPSYTELKAVRPALSSFAAQVVKQKFVAEVKQAVKPGNGLHVSLNCSILAPGSIMITVTKIETRRPSQATTSVKTTPRGLSMAFYKYPDCGITLG